MNAMPGDRFTVEPREDEIQEGQLALDEFAMFSLDAIAEISLTLSGTRCKTNCAPKPA